MATLANNLPGLITNVTTDNSPYSIPETMRRFIGGVKPGFNFDSITTLRGALELVADFDNFIIFTRYMFESLEVSAYDHGAADHFANDADLSARMIAVMKALGYSFELAPSQGSTSFNQMVDGKEARVIFWQHGEDSDNWDITFTHGTAVTLRRDNVEGLDALTFAAFLENFNPMIPISEGLERLGFEENKDASVDGVTVFSRGEYEIHVSRGLSYAEFTAVYYYKGRDCTVLGNRIAADIVETAKLADTWE